MQCFIYRCSNRPDLYVYLAEEDVFDNLPKELFNTLGIIEFSMELELTPKTELAREDTQKVIDNLNEHGFHIQLPANESLEEIMARIAERKNRDSAR